MDRNAMITAGAIACGVAVIIWAASHMLPQGYGIPAADGDVVELVATPEAEAAVAAELLAPPAPPLATADEVADLRMALGTANGAIVLLQNRIKKLEAARAKKTASKPRPKALPQ